MDTNTILLIVGTALLAGFITYLLLYNIYATIKAEHTLLKSSNQTLTSELTQERVLLQSASSAKHELDRRLTEISTDYRNLRDRYDEMVLNKDQEEERFQSLATKIIDQKTAKFDAQHKAGIKEILEPLKEKIKLFETKVDVSNKDSMERHTALKYQIQNLTNLNEKMTTEATNLTKALKGDSKIQGNWGELILESVLEKSGLEKNREYFLQQTFDQDGHKVRPDVIIHLPDGKRLIIDSKVSLTAYEQMIRADGDNIKVFEKAHLLSVRKHIDGLSAKNYHDIYQIESPDFVLLFIPIDTAFASAIKLDPSLYQYAFDKNLVIVTPSTLLATLKTVDTLWKNEKQQKHALDIAIEAGKMYDKFVGLVQDLEKLGNQMDTARGTYQSSMKKLSEGSGNLVARAQKIKALGAKANKRLD